MKARAATIVCCMIAVACESQTSPTKESGGSAAQLPPSDPGAVALPRRTEFSGVPLSPGETVFYQMKVPCITHGPPGGCWTDVTQREAHAAHRMGVTVDSGIRSHPPGMGPNEFQESFIIVDTVSAAKRKRR